MVTGMYGKPVPKQDGAPLCLALPWKYGFKSAKSIVHVSFTEVDQWRPFVSEPIPQDCTCARMRNPSSGCGGAKYTVTRWNVSSVT